MENFILLLRELEYSSNTEKITKSLKKIIEKINTLLSKIETCKSLEEAQDYFALLDIIQGLIMKLYFKKETLIPKELWEFARDFDRIDDEQTQLHLFNEIKSKRYNLKKNKT